MSESLKNLIDEFNDITSNPENFLSVQEETCKKTKILVKHAYDLLKEEDSNKHFQCRTLPQLIVEGVDIEQIWQQIELLNEEILSDNNILEINRLLTNKNSLLFDNKSENEQEQNNESIGSLSADSDASADKNESNLKNASLAKFGKPKCNKFIQENEQLSDESSSENGKVIADYKNELDVDYNSSKKEEFLDSTENQKNKSSSESDDDSYTNIEQEGKSISQENVSSDDNHDRQNEQNYSKKQSIVDDDFFKLDEMENFLNTEEKKINKPNKKIFTDDEGSSDEESIDLFKSEQIPDAVESSILNPRFKDFFRKQEKESKPIKRNKFLEDLENEPGDDNRPKTKFEQREERLQEKIKVIEEKALSDKLWTMKGEITAEKRPINSLLEEVLEFDHATRPAPIITEEAAQMLEDVILQRIKDKAFDDVERKKRVIETPLEYKKKLVLEQEKSKESLAQIYEKEYLQQKEALSADLTEKEDEPEIHKEIKGLRYKLFAQLDALCNFHFTPKLPAPELKVITNLPAINMEEVAPIAMSDAALLAPEEIKRKQKGELKSKIERTVTDKKRERRKKKLKQKIHAQQKAKRESLTKQNIGKFGKKKKEIQMSKGNNVTKMVESNGISSIKSSRAFFDQLQGEVRTQIYSKVKAKQSEKSKGKIDAKKIKL